MDKHDQEVIGIWLCTIENEGLSYALTNYTPDDELEVIQRNYPEIGRLAKIARDTLISLQPLVDELMETSR